MSRTYRRSKDKAPNWVTKNWEWNNSITGIFWIAPPLTGKAAKKEVSKWHSDAGWHNEDYNGFPKWFNKLHHIIPERREAKRVQRKVLELIDYEDSPEFPLCRGKTEYYW
jgi:hypothetical protein